MYSMFHLLINGLHEIVIWPFFGLSLILWISINNHINWTSHQFAEYKTVSNMGLLIRWNEHQQCLLSLDLVKSFNLCIQAGYVAPHIIEQYNNSACTKA